jgi:hypothetical protein
MGEITTTDTLIVKNDVQHKAVKKYELYWREILNPAQT